MNQTPEQFRTVLRGYDPLEVDRLLADLHARLESAEAETHRQQERALRAESAAIQRGEPAAAEPPSYGHLGERVGRILTLADEEAAQLRDGAVAEVEGLRTAAEQASAATRAEADAYAEKRRADAETEAARITADAARAADQERDAAERDASARRQEAEALYEQQRAQAAAAAADFETTLADRRDKTAAEFQAQQGQMQQQMDALNEEIEQRREQARVEHETALAESRRVLEEAQARADALIADARKQADRVKLESDRELTAATQRRDSINAQLRNVRQMLATLSGTAAVVDPLAVLDEARVGADDTAADPVGNDEHPMVDEGEAPQADDVDDEGESTEPTVDGDQEQAEEYQQA